MNSLQSNFPETPCSDHRMQPVSDYGTFGPASDFEGESQHGSPANDRRLQFAAVLAGAGLAIVIAAGGAASAVWGKVDSVFSGQGVISAPGVVSDRELDHQKPQEQAELLLEQAVSRSDAANDQITQRANRWRGRLHWDSELGALTTAALNSTDLRIRASGIEVQLAAYGLAEDDSSVDGLVRQAESSDHARKIWALWSLGLIGSRGIEPRRTVAVLAAHLRDADEDSRRWAVEGLALVGIDQTIAPLLQTMRDDPSAMVRERAACSLAQTGMLTHEQRLRAVPQLLNFSDDPSLDARTQAWAFQALSDITGQRLPNDAAAWRAWYQESGARD